MTDVLNEQLYLGWIKKWIDCFAFDWLIDRLIVQAQDIGLDYMTLAARMGDAGSALYLAKAFDTGLNLGSNRKVS